MTNARRVSKGVALSASFLMVAAGAAACGSDTPDYRAVCINPNTKERLPDRACDDDRRGSYDGFVPVPYYYPGSYDGSYSRVGERVQGGRATLPKGSNVSVTKPGSISSKGGSASKAVRGGGLGGGSKASG